MDDEEFTRVLGGGGSGFSDKILHLPTLKLVYESLKDLPQTRLKLHPFVWLPDPFWLDCIDKEKWKAICRPIDETNPWDRYIVKDDDIQSYTTWRIDVVNAGWRGDEEGRWKHLVEWLEQRIAMNVGSNGC